MKKNNKRIVMMASIILVFAVAISGTIAWLFTQTNEVVNTFKPTSVPNSINETFNGNTKTNVSISNTGNIDAYIRAEVVVTWQDADGNVLPDKPVPGTNYSIEINKAADVFGGKWVEYDGYYYYTRVVPADDDASTTDRVEDQTAILITSCSPTTKAPVDGYTLHVEILSQSIQADGVNSTTNKTPVQEAWGVTISGGTVTAVS